MLLIYTNDIINQKGQTGTTDEIIGTGENEVENPDSEDLAGANELIQDPREIIIQDTKSNHGTDFRTKDIEAAHFREMKKQGEVDLNMLSSISGGGGVKSGRSNPGVRGNVARPNFAHGQSTGKRKFE